MTIVLTELFLALLALLAIQVWQGLLLARLAGAVETATRALAGLPTAADSAPVPRRPWVARPAASHSEIRLLVDDPLGVPPPSEGEEDAVPG